MAALFNLNIIMKIEATQKYLKLKDYSVTQEAFELYYDSKLDLLKTVPMPNNEDLGRYYESEDYISHTDGKRSLFEKIYQTVKKKAIHDKLDIVERAVTDRGILLDIGAGTGDFLKAAHDREWEVLGFEPNEKAKSNAQKKGVSFINSLDEIPNGSISVITMWHVLEHVPNLDEYLNTLHRLLKVGGVLIVAVPNFKSYDAQYYGKFWAAYDVPRHIWHFSQSAIEQIFLPLGFVLEQKYPMYFDSYYVSLLSEKIKTGKINYIKAFLIGLKSNVEARKTTEYSSIIYQLLKK